MNCNCCALSHVSKWGVGGAREYCTSSVPRNLRVVSIRMTRSRSGQQFFFMVKPYVLDHVYVCAYTFYSRASESIPEVP